LATFLSLILFALVPLGCDGMEETDAGGDVDGGRMDGGPGRSDAGHDAGGGGTDAGSDAAVPSCTDGLANGDETDVDCGGTACGPCDDGDMCGVAGDCVSMVCTANVCVATSCTDGVMNGDETDVDCGGSCAGCGDGAMCAMSDDCGSLVCVGNLCQAATCTDGVLNGAETDLDCGGPLCVPCVDGDACALARDCDSGVCTALVCAAPTCSDGVQNGGEADVDCGPGCSPCANGSMCTAPAHCASGVCDSGTCVAPTCTDGALNGTETDLDCGGPSCAPCANGLMCVMGSRDCVSGVCTGGTCAAPTCGDGVRNGAETDVDCGGSGACPRCGHGLACAAATDCSTAGCVGMTCVDGPTAGFTISPTSGVGTPLLVTATSTATAGDAAITSVQYDWGVGAGFVAAATHNYTATGPYTITQRVTDMNGLTATTTRPLSITAFTPVRISSTDRDTNVLLSPDGLEVENRGLDRGGARSDRSIATGSGVFYYEAHRLIGRVGVWGFGVATAAASRLNLPGETAQSAGILTFGDVINPGGCTGSGYVGGDYDRYGFVVDYRGTNPIVHILVDRGTGVELVDTCTMAVTAPVFAFYSGARYEVGVHARFNFGNDTTNFPFTYTRSAIQAQLTAGGFSSAAGALVMGWGQTRAPAAEAAPVISAVADQTIALGSPVTFTATATDTEDGNLTANLQWADLATNHFAPVSATGGTFTFTPTALGVHPIRVRVTDSNLRTTERIAHLTVTGTLPQFDPVRLIVEPHTGFGMTLSPDAHSVRYGAAIKSGIRANQGCLGQFWYYEAHRLLPMPTNIGAGLTVHDGNLDPYDFDDPPWSMSINTLGDTWHNLISQSNWTNTESYYGFAVDYRGDHPIVYVIITGVVQRVVDMTQTHLPVYPLVYGSTLTTMAPDYDMQVNFGETAFHYDPTTILMGAGVDMTGFEAGWGDANTP
ncbi:MAG: hypothetical protein AB7P00_16155, partial [Sandaracinaceae bacterium]